MKRKRMGNRSDEESESSRERAVGQPEGGESGDMAEGRRGLINLRTLRYLLLARKHFLTERGYNIEKKHDHGYIALIDRAFSNWKTKFPEEEGGSVNRTDGAQLKLMKPYRILIRALVRGAVEYAKAKRKEGDAAIEATGTAPYTDAEMELTKATVSKGSAAPGLGQLHKYAGIILPWDLERKRMDTRLYDVYVAINERYGEDEGIAGDDGVVRCLGVKQWPVRLYFESNWFRQVPPHRQGRRSGKNFKPGVFLSVVKFCVDSLLFRSGPNKKRKRAKDGSHTGNTRETFNADVYGSMGVAVEMIVHAWGEFARKLGFENGMEELVSAFLYFDEGDCMLKVTEEGLCVPTESNNRKLLIRKSGAEGSAGVVYASCARLKKLDDKTVKEWHDFARACIGDFYDGEMWDEIIGTGVSDVGGLACLAKYVEVDGGLGSRFGYENGVIQKFRRRRLMALIACDEDEDEGGAALDEGEESSTYEMDNTVESHVCRAQCDCRKILDGVQHATSGYPKIYHTSFSKLIDEIEKDDGDIRGEVQLILSDPPYNVRRTGGKADSDYDSLSINEIRSISKICGELLREGGHVILFCSIAQYKLYAKAFGDEKTKEGALMFSVSTTPLVFIPKAGTYGRVMNRRKLTYTNITEFAFHAARRGGKQSETMKMVNWKHFGYIESTHAAHTNVVDGVRMEKGERLTAGRGMVRPEQKSLGLFQELIERNTKPDDIVVDFFAGTGTAAVACVATLGHREFYGCDIKREVVSEARDRVRRALVYRAGAGTLGSSLGIPEKEMGDLKMLYERWGYDKVVPRGIGMRSQGGVVVVRRKAIIQQVLESAILKQLCVIHGDRGFLRMTGRRPEDYERGLLGKLNCTDVERLLESYLVSYDLYVDGGDELRGKELRAQRTFEAGSVIGYIFGCVFLGTWDAAREGDSICGTGMLEVDGRTYRKAGFKILPEGESIVINEITYGSAVIVAGEHCPFRYVAEEGGEYNCGVRLTGATLKILENPHALEVFATRKIEAGEAIIPSRQAIK